MLTREQLQGFVDRGFTDAQIGREFGCGENKIYNLRHKYGVPAGRKQGRFAGDPRNDGGRKTKLGRKRDADTKKKIKASMQEFWRSAKARSKKTALPPLDPGASLDSYIADFLARGGRIVQCPPADCAGFVEWSVPRGFAQRARGLRE